MRWRSCRRVAFQPRVDRTRRRPAAGEVAAEQPGGGGEVGVEHGRARNGRKAGGFASQASKGGGGTGEEIRDLNIEYPTSDLERRTTEVGRGRGRQKDEGPILKPEGGGREAGRKRTLDIEPQRCTNQVHIHLESIDSADCGLFRTDNPQLLLRSVKQSRRSMFTGVKRVLAIFALWHVAAALRGVVCRQVSARRSESPSF